MKKFFSLVLALVMALSLTTVAWGEPMTAADLETALASVAEGGTYKLENDVTGAVTISKSVTLDLNGKTMSSSSDTISVTSAGVVLTIKDSVGTGKVISDGQYCGAIYVKNGKVIIEGGTFEGTFVDDSYAAYVSANGTLVVNGGTLKASGTAANGYTYGVVVGTNDPSPCNATLEVNGGTISATNGIAIVSDESWSGVTINITGGTISGTNGALYYIPQNAAVTISGGTFSSDVSDYVVPGMSLVNGTVENNAGQFNTLTGGAGTNATAGTYGATLDAALADTTYSVVMQDYAPAVPEVKSFATYGLLVTHKVNQTVTSEGPFVKVPTALNADYVFVSGSNIVYLAAVPTVNKYNDDATATKVALNSALYAKCNEVYVDDASEAGTYYLYKTEYYEEVTPAQAEIIFNVKGVVVYAAKTTKVNVQPHAYKYDTVQTNGTAGKAVTKVYCSACNKTFEFVDSTTEADAIKKFGAGNYEAAIAGVKGTIYVRTASTLPAGTVVVPSTSTTVESAQTFDAGIAMYVGMSVMAAAGSAVVIGKKKD